MLLKPVGANTDMFLFYLILSFAYFLNLKKTLKFYFVLFREVIFLFFNSYRDET